MLLRFHNLYLHQLSNYIVLVNEKMKCLMLTRYMGPSINNVSNFSGFLTSPSPLSAIFSKVRLCFSESPNFKVHIIWEGHKILRNLHLTFDYSTKSKVKISQNFMAFLEYMNCTIYWQFRPTYDPSPNSQMPKSFMEGPYANTHSVMIHVTKVIND